MDDELIKKEQALEKLRNTTLLTTDIKELAFQDILQSKSKEIGELLPKHLNIQRFIRSAMVAISRNPRLMECTRKSLFLACIDAAEVGLDFNPSKGWAYLIPYKNEAQFMPGYKGFIELMMRSGELEDIDAQIVYETDIFEYQLGTTTFIKHIPSLDEHEAPIIASYAVATLKSGKQKVEIIPFSELEKIHKKSKAPTSPAWEYFYGEMYRKIVIKRIRKYVRISTNELDVAIEKDNDQFGIDFNDNQQTESLSDKIDSKLVEAGIEVPEVESDPEEQVPKSETEKPVKQDNLGDQDSLPL